MPVNIINEYAEEMAEKRRHEEIAKEQAEFGADMIKIVQKQFDTPVYFTLKAHPSNAIFHNNRWEEYRIYNRVQKGFFRLHATRLVAQVGKHLKDGKVITFKVIVLKPEHEELAKDIAGILSIAYTDEITIKILHKPEGF
jgi:hypothetical protein